VKDLSLEIKQLLKKLNMNPNRDSDEVAGIVNNFKSIIVEATFAYSFEVVNMPLCCEQSPADNKESSIDFLLKTQDGKNIYFDIRVNQQQKKFRKRSHNS
jgi:hypothetical protein